MSMLIGVTGYARSGKDTLYERSKIFLEKEGKKVIRFAFADALKYECDDFLKKNVGISAFTEDSKEKEIIRPFLVTYGTEIRRKLDENCWIKSIQDKVVDSLNKGFYVFITDVRFKNEAQWVNINGGIITHITREGIKPANHEEHRQYHFYKPFINYHITWETFGQDKISECDSHVFPLLNHIISQTPTVEALM